jgi:hypothetical protein
LSSVSSYPEVVVNVETESSFFPHVNGFFPGNRMFEVV